jgi:hypothetical protein
MGRMKDIFIEVMETYGTIPDDFNLDEYRLKKEMSDAEWQEHERKVEECKKREATNQSTEGRDSMQGSDENSYPPGEENKS